MTGAATELLPATRDALSLLLLAMADDEFVIGFSDSEWTGIAPMLEEDVAMSSLAQDELGHAQALYRLLAEVVDDGRDADAIAYDRPVEGYYHARLLDHPRGDWADTIARRYLYDTADGIRLDALAESSYAPLRELVAKIRREERYHRMHVTAWLDRLASAPGEPRERLLGGARSLGARCRDRVVAAAERAEPGDGGDPRDRRGGARCPLAGGDRPGVRTPRPVDAAARRRPDDGPDEPFGRLPLAVGRVHLGPPRAARSDVVTAVAAPVVDEAVVRAALADVADPEIPAISIVDLGIVERVEVADDAIRVDLLPTFVGCPALDAIGSAVEERLAGFGRPVEVRFGFSVPWTTDRITERGRRQLTKSGFAPPGDDTCPYCGSANVLTDNLFGPTQCRSVRYCRSCRQPFEAFKLI